MSKLSAFFALAVLFTGLNVSAGDSAPNSSDFRQTYRLDAEKTKVNAARMVQDLKKIPETWKEKPAFYYVIPPFSDVPRLPDAYPDDGVPAGTVRLIASLGEFEAGSVLIAPQKNVDRFTLVSSDLKDAQGNVIPASSLDIKMVKNWYQAGSGWYGYFADALGRKLTPELLLNDENMVRVVPETKDNYVRYSNEDGSSFWQWMSANFVVVNYSFDNQANQGLIADAPTLQPVVLNKNEFKQYMITVHVPANAAGGLYQGNIALVADGQNIGNVPVSLKVLPFALPNPKSNYDMNKGYYLCLYGQCSRNPVILKNLANHNCITPMGFPYIDVFSPEKFREDLALARESGIITRPILSGAQGVGIQSKENPVGSEAQTLKNLKNTIQKTADLCKKELGHTEFYSYGVDEGGPSTIRAERNAWKIAHDAGGKIMVSTFAHRELLFALDYMILPGAPQPNRAEDVRLFHASNPDALCGWYANPHSGPENPDYFRRLHGFQQYHTGYDAATNYCWWRNNWNDMAVPYEPGLRSIIMVYDGRDNTFDTLAWEGVREGMDDVKYASYLKELALEASKSQDGDVLMLGRRVLSWLAFIDDERAGLDTFRIECINYILRLRAALKKGN